MKKICYCTTIPATISSFILKSAEYIHENTDWDISFICDYDEEFAKSLPDYIHYYPIPMKRGISLGGITAMREMKKIFKREKFDLVQYTTPNASLYGAIAAKLAKIPVRVYNQGGIIYVGFSGVKRKIFKLVEKLTCKLSTWIEPVSKSNLEFARSEKLYSESNSSIIWNGSVCGVNLDKFDVSKKSEYRTAIREKYNIPDDAFVFIFVARINRDKGTNELLEAYKNMSTERPCYLLMVGPSEVDANVNMDLYNWSTKEEKIIYTGETKTVEQYLAAADCFVLPSYREGFGLSIIEAGAMSMPVIVTDIPGPIDAMVPGKTGIVIPKQDVNALQGAMEAMLDDSVLREQLAAEGYTYVLEHFEQKKFFVYALSDMKRLLGEQ